MVANILHVYNDFEPEKGGGGVARHIAGLAEMLATLGFRVRVVAKIVDSAAGSGVYQVERVRWYQFWRHVVWADIVHIHGARKPYAGMAAFLALLLGRRLIYTPHCYYDSDGGTLKTLSKRLWDATGEQWLLRHSNAVILLSEYWLQYLAARRLTVTRPVIIPNCVLGREVDGRRIPRGGKLRGAPSLLSVGRLDSVKRIDDAIRVLNCATLSGAILHIVGRGPDHERLAALADELGVSDRVQFYGFTGDNKVARMAAAADVFVMPSAVEGMPTVLIEMILMSLPVVASDIPGNRTVLDLLGLEVMFPLGDVLRMAERITQVAGKPLSETVEYAVRDNFTWERTVHRICALYQESNCMRAHGGK